VSRAPVAAPVTRSAAHYALALLTLVYVFNFVDRQILSILLEPIRRDLGVSDTAMGFLTGPAFALFYTLAGIPIARWADRGVRRDIIAIGLALWSGMTALSGLATQYWHLAFARVGVGVGEASCSPAAHSLIADYFPRERRATAMSIYSSGINIGIMAGFVIGGWMSEAFGWRSAFFIVGLPGILVAVIVRTSLREPPRSASASTASFDFIESLKALWSLRAFRHVCLGAALASVVGYAFLTWNPAFLERTHGMSRGEIGTWLGLASGLGGALGTLLGGVLADRLGARDPRWHAWIPSIGRLLSLPCLVLFTTQSNSTTALLWFVPAQIFGAFWFGPVFGLTQGLVPPAMRAFASAVLLFVVNVIGLGLGPQIVGLMSDAFGARLGADGLRASLLCVCAVEIWAAFHFFRSARWLVLDTSPRAT
jgi:predicted MFS family arabinose efflux permease